MQIEMTPAEFLEIRTKAELSQREFGVALGFTPEGAQRSVCALENGERKIKPAVAKLATYIKKHGIIK